jgi:uncharacterized membrane protein YgdD (TMEM256/DUF423 family)
MHRSAWLGVAALNAVVALRAALVALFVTFNVPRVEANLMLAAGAGFQMVHALAIVGLCALGWPRDNVAWLFFYGILLFSGSLYMRALGATAPVLIIGALGAVLLLLGWLSLAWTALTGPRRF